MKLIANHIHFWLFLLLILSVMVAAQEKRITFLKESIN